MRKLNVLAGLLISLAAFSTLAVGFVWTANATEPTRDAVIAPEPEPAEVQETSIAPGAQNTPAPTEAVETEPELEAVAEAPSEEAPAPAPTGIEVPELTGRTALRAFRQARAAGLVAEINDPDGRRVPPSERLYMRVVEQETAAGEHVEEGSTVSLVARYPRAGFASGY